MADSEQCNIPCVICGTFLDKSLPGADYETPFRGTTFVGRGDYGSILDGWGAPNIEVIICDNCLLTATDRSRVNKVIVITPPKAREQRFPLLRMELEERD